LKAAPKDRQIPKRVLGGVPGVAGPGQVLPVLEKKATESQRDHGDTAAGFLEDITTISVSP
jgi:hypothetical protein